MSKLVISAHSDVTSDENNRIVPYYVPSLSYLPDDDATYYVQSIDGLMAEQPEIDDLSVKITLIRYPAITPPAALTHVKLIRVSVPFSDFRYFGVGSTFYKRQQVSRKFDSVQKTLTSFRPKSFVEGFVGRTENNDPAAMHVMNRHYLSENFKTIYRENGTAFLESRYRGQPIFLPVMEIFRFYFGSFDKLTRRLLLCYAFPEMEAALPWIEAETGSDGEKFVITPRIGFADHATCLQIAIFLSNPDLMKVLKSVVSAIRSHVLTGSIVAPIIEFPAGAKDLRVLIRQTHVRQTPKSSYSKARFAQQILSDNRNMPFSHLIIRDPRSEPHRSKARTQGPSKPQNELLPDAEQSNPCEDPENNDPFAPEIAYLAPPGFIDSFPGIERTNIKVEYTKPKSVTPKRPNWMEKLRKFVQGSHPPENKVDNALPPKPTGKPTLRPPLRTIYRNGKKVYERQTGYKLFVPIDDIEHYLIGIEGLDIDERTGCTIEALNICAKKKWKSKSGELIRFQYPLILNIKASLDGGPITDRYVVFSIFEVSGLNGCVIEVIRRTERSIALGVVLRTDGGGIGPREIARIMSHYRRRIILRGSEERTSRENYAGVWPTYRDYDDVHGARLVHKAPLDSPAFLAAAICEVSSNLVVNITS